MDEPIVAGTETWATVEAIVKTLGAFGYQPADGDTVRAITVVIETTDDNGFVGQQVMCVDGYQGRRAQEAILQSTIGALANVTGLGLTEFVTKVAECVICRACNGDANDMATRLGIF